jgi:integrase
MKYLTTGNKFTNLIAPNKENDFLRLWFDIYFEIEVTTLPSSRKVQERDLNLLISFMIETTGNDYRQNWTPRVGAEFKNYLRSVIEASGKRRWNDRTINRILAHVKTFAKWINKIAPFPLGNPMEKIKAFLIGNLLEIERAITPPERRKILDAADYLIISGGHSKDRTRFKDVNNRPVRKGYRPYRNRAIIYTLIETGMRRAAVTSINFSDVDTDLKKFLVEEKGGVQHSYNISTEGINAIRDYIINEREADDDHWQVPALFLASKTIQRSSGRLNTRTINHIWTEVCKPLNIKKSPHCARHAMGRHIMEKTGNLAAVQRQLGHKDPASSMQYARVTDKELKNILDER